jgi:hypothetical protein
LKSLSRNLTFHGIAQSSFSAVAVLLPSVGAKRSFSIWQGFLQLHGLFCERIHPDVDFPGRLQDSGIACSWRGFTTAFGSVVKKAKPSGPDILSSFERYTTSSRSLRTRKGDCPHSEQASAVVFSSVQDRDSGPYSEKPVAGTAQLLASPSHRCHCTLRMLVKP